MVFAAKGGINENYKIFRIINSSKIQHYHNQWNELKKSK